MIKYGMHEATVIDSNTINIDGANYPCASKYKPDTTISVLYTYTKQFIPIEVSSPKYKDEATIMRELDYELSIPTTGEIVSLFGPRRSPTGMGDEFHEGIDIANRIDTPIYAVQDGIVEDVREDAHYGLHVIIEHEGGLKSIYAHLNSTCVNTGDIVTNKQLIGAMGNTGKSSGPHLHLGLQYYGKDLNPRVFYDRQGMAIGATVYAE